jgi:phosphoadenosine phosphosulfate reductase
VGVREAAAGPAAFHAAPNLVRVRCPRGAEGRIFLIGSTFGTEFYSYFRTLPYQGMLLLYICTALGRATGGSMSRLLQYPDQQGEETAAALNRRLAETATLEARLGELLRTVHGRVAFSTSLGLEDQAILHAASQAAPGIDIFTLDTGRLFPETVETLDRSENRYSLRIRIVAPDAQDVEALVARDGVFGFRLSVEARKACCDVRKVRPLRRALAGAVAWITGLRRGQAAGRTTVAFAAWDAEHSLIKINPIADWTLERLEAYTAANDVPVNPLHAQGFASIGCQPCTRALKPGEDLRAGRWWWEQEDGKECGLHNNPRRPAAREAAA